MLSQFFTIDLNLNARSTLVSFATAIIFPLLFVMANEFLYWDLVGVEFTLVCITLCLCGYVFAEILPAVARMLPFALGAVVIAILFASLTYQIFEKQNEEEGSRSFFEATNYCEGHALVNKDLWPACVKSNSRTIRNWCLHISGNEYDCKRLYKEDVVSRPKWVTDKSN